MQMQIDLGGEIRKACKVCGMEYIPSNAEDAALHKRFHDMNVDGIEMGRAFVEYIGANAVARTGSDSFIAVITRRDSLGARNRAKRVLNVVNSELSAVAISDNHLWGLLSISHPHAAGVNVRIPPSSDAFKVFLYIQGTACVGLCLAAAIASAQRVLRQGSPDPKVGSSPGCKKSSSVVASVDSEPVLMGISRLWTSRSHRAKGIATNLLDAAADAFLYGFRIPKDKIAFSQPTESGCRLARKWFGAEDGWHVYVE